MKVYEVWHAVPADFYAVRPVENFPLGFNMVAAVTAENVDEVFDMTNHIHNPWMENEGVAPKVLRARSTSVGDVVVDRNAKVMYRCEACGWSTKEMA
jgi:hypothetical protein